MRLSVAIWTCGALLGPAVLACNAFDYAPDFCERNDQCPSGLCDTGKLRCAPAMVNASENRDASSDGRDSSEDLGSGDPAADAIDTTAGAAGGGPVGGSPGNGAVPADAAPPPCVGDEACPADAPLCLAGRCAKCAAATDCTGRPGAPACDATSGRCLECVTQMDCPDPARAFCLENRCAGCAMVGTGACSGSTPTCDSASGKCVECTDSGLHCRSNPAAAFCVMNRCLGCQMAPAGSCTDPAPICDSGSGRCVECTDQAQHCKTAGKAFCRGNVCVGCQVAGNDACGGGAPACDRGSGRCVECVSSSDCGLQEPVCRSSENRCGPCTNDAQCSSRPGGPGVCMFHQAGGRCASDSETLYVSSAPGCGSGSRAGSPSMPFCAPQAALNALTSSRRLLVIRGPRAVPGFSLTSEGPQVSIIGQDDALITGINRTGITLDNRDLYLRDLSVSGGNQIGILARSDGTLRLERVKVKDNRNLMPVAGGIFIDGAAFEIENCLISGNGPGVDELGAFWGGLRVQAARDSLSRLDRVSLVDNENTGLSCAESIDGRAVYARNPGQGDISPSCDVTPCATPGPGCGSDLEP